MAQPKGNTAAELLLADLRCALPASGWADTGCHAHDTRPLMEPPGKWQILDYRTELFAGSMLRTTHPDSAELRIPLGRSGWHAVSIGMVNPWMAHTQIEVRLSGHEHWHLLGGFSPTRHELDTAACTVHEEPWIFADLTDRALEIRYPRTPHRALQHGGYAAICSVRATPVNPRDLPVITGRRHCPTVHFCGSLFEYDPRFDTDQWDIVCGNNSNCADLVKYPSATGTEEGGEAWDTAPGVTGRLTHVHHLREQLSELEASGEHPLRAVIERAHRHGKRFWLATRPQMWAMIPPFHHLYRSPFYAAHPEYRCREADGTATSKLSLAFPDVREQLAGPLREALEWGADGITVLFNRGYPLVRYEDPVAHRFRQRFDKDVRTIDQADPRLLGIWAEFVTEWIRELRRLVDDNAPAGGGELTVFTGPSLEWNLQFGIDVAGWAREGLVDVVLPYPRHHHTARLYGEIYDRPDGWIDVAGYAAALGGTDTKLIPSMGHWGDHDLPLARMRERAHRFYTGGATGVCRWDTDIGLALVQLDDPEIQRLWCETYCPPQDNLMTELGGLNLVDFPPGIGG